MFKKFEDTNVSGSTQLKSSVQKAIRNKLTEQFPNIESFIDEIIPKKENLKIPRSYRTHNPFICPLMQVDKGAITFVLSGANIMCPGLTSKGAIMTDGLQQDTIVTVVAENKQNAIAVGILKMSVENISKINKGIAIENVHYLNDGLWRLKSIK
ncbi:PUA domain-containing protein [Sarcoptes scabiei]|uniref:PUA domain-containing protein n=1 Tax=Sarcoptes scabiei TaxID=52283 RepID=A0A132A7D2_SARSC|nr:PUA domain-containing protein [Sarcoptes scabiei]